MVTKYAGDVLEEIWLIRREVAVLNLIDAQRQIAVFTNKVVRVVSKIRW